MDDDVRPDAAVQIRGYFNYDSGEPYRIFTLLRDVPEVALANGWQDDVAGPPHAAKGDELWEDKQDRGQCFRLKRDDYVVARPEWWQVRDVLFSGECPGWRRKKDATKPTPQGPGLLRGFEVEIGGETVQAWLFLRAFSGGQHETDVPAGAVLFKCDAPKRGGKYMQPWTIIPDLEKARKMVGGHDEPELLRSVRKLLAMKDNGSTYYGVSERFALELRRIDEIERVSEYRAALRAIGAPFPADGTSCTAYAFVEADVPGLLRRGSVLVYAKDVEDRPALRVAMRELTLGRLRALARRLERNPEVTDGDHAGRAGVVVSVRREGVPREQTILGHAVEGVALSSTGRATSVSGARLATARGRERCGCAVRPDHGRGWKVAEANNAPGVTYVCSE